ncbi:MAG: glycoside hydrolase, partial [Lachnospiraceae bacterium]|nr:glycoside hydrolase [Lachnospiraceae bacterium]
MEGFKTLTREEAPNMLYPFFWQHGESHSVLGEYMEKIASVGIKGVCVEARPHPEFVADGWWQDMDFLLKKAKEFDMKLWILDDSHFPTGFANGRIKKDYPQYLKWYLDMRRYDVQGPMEGARIDFRLLKGRPWERPDKSEKILGIYMAQRLNQRTEENDSLKSDSFMDITENMDMENRLLTLDIPEGAHSIFVVYQTRKGGEETTADYLNPLIKEATHVLIDEVYEPHYAHYKEEFGKTIQGFFS